ncbi:hypothetical protein PY650_23100 [Rhizobium calliandrae]|uniref:Transposase n=1 Tax=Rhizobium calliandrae TaxID=1312182 RepID=A0ABT7KIL1_9HYPH|nr:hypothetical protein [Rhizobium calliandrae]MDL2408479.1 hypothetical protein [Rhizobium calliandrae]
MFIAKRKAERSEQRTVTQRVVDRGMDVAARHRIAGPDQIKGALAVSLPQWWSACNQCLIIDRAEIS